VVAYGSLKAKENFKLSNLETFGILENWSLRRGGRNRRFDCIKIQLGSEA